MQANALMADTNTPINIENQSTLVALATRSKVLKPPAKKINGTDNKKENRAEVSRVKPRKRPAVIVIPEREVPGISANT